MNEGDRTSLVKNLSGGISGRQIVFRFLLSLLVALAARVIYGVATNDGPPESKAVVSESSLLGQSAGTTSAPVTPSTASIVASTTVFESDPQKALENLARALTAKDYSKIAEGDCTKAAVIVLVDNVLFFKWTEEGWTEYSDLISMRNVGAPLAVTSADFTGDGMIDYLVTYEAPNSTDPFVGGIFAATRCAWNWLDFESSSGRSKLASTLSFDVSDKSLTAAIDATSDVPVDLRFDQERFTFEFLSSSADTVSAVTEGAVDDDRLVSFFESLAKWTLEGFNEMEEWTAPFSPAQDYARHLGAGREAELLGGFVEGTPLDFRREGDSYRVCFTDACEYYFTDFVLTSNGITDFKVNGLLLSDIVRFNQSPEAGAMCSEAGTCVNWRSLYSGIETSYVVLNVSGLKSEKKIEFAGATLSTEFGKRRQDKFVAAVLEPGSSGVWLLRFPTVEPPIGGNIVLRVRLGGKVYSHEIQLPNW